MTEFFTHPQAICEATEVGRNTRIWAFAHVLPGARIGSECNICDSVFIENDVTIGDRTTVKCGVQLWDGIRLGRGVFVGPNVTFANDRFPRSKQPPPSYTQTIVEDGASIGANATVLPGVTIGTGAMVGAGSVVVRDVPSRAVIVGNPAGVIGYAGATAITAGNAAATMPRDFGPKLISLPSFVEPRGRLSVADDDVLSFFPARLFIVDRVPPGGWRGSHAHRVGQQLMIVTSGQMVIVVDDGRQAFEITLADSTNALFIPPRIWSLQFGHSSDAKLLVLCSAAYDRTDYISSYKEFVSLTGELR